MFLTWNKIVFHVFIELFVCFVLLLLLLLTEVTNNSDGEDDDNDDDKTTCDKGNVAFVESQSDRENVGVLYIPQIVIIIVCIVLPRTRSVQINNLFCKILE